MSFWQDFIESLESLSANKMCSGLTILGVVIGVAAVISMLAIGTGAQTSINTSIQSIGTNLIFVTPGAQNVRNPRPLTLQDAQALQDPLPPQMSKAWLHCCKDRLPPHLAAKARSLQLTESHQITSPSAT